ncbi:MAG: diguanylate cyclase [Nitrospiria bacterium]
MTRDAHKPASHKMKVALVGGNQEGLLTLASLTRDPATEVVMLIDQDQKALAFRLHEYGFTFDKIFTFTLSSDINELKSIGDLDLIVDASDDANAHQALYRLNHPTAEIMTSQCARILWEIKSSPINRTAVESFDLTESSDAFPRRQDILLKKGGELLSLLAGSFPADEVSRFFLDALLHTLQGNWGALYFEDADEEVLRRFASRFLLPSGEEPPGWRLLKEGLADFTGEWVKKEKTVLFLGSPFREPWMEKLMTVLKFHQYLVIPLFDQDRFLGVLELGKWSAGSDWTTGDVEFIKKWISHEGVKNYLLAARKDGFSLEPLTRNLRNIFEQTKSIQEKLDEGTAEIGLFLGASSLLFVKDPESGDLVLQSQVGSALKMNGVYRMKPDEGMGGAALMKGRPVHLKEEDVQSGTRGPMSVLYYPLIIKGQGVGLLILEFRKPAHPYQKWKKDLKEVVEILAISISGDVERKSMAQKVLKLSVVNEEGLELVSTTNRDKVLMMASASAAMILEAEGVILRVKEKESARLLVGYTYGLHNEPMDKLLLQVDAVVASRAADTRQAILSPSLKAIVESKVKLPAKFPYHSVLSVPLLDQNTVVGTLSVYNKVIANSFVTASFNDTDKELIEKYGHFISKALVKAKEFQNREKLITIDDLTGLKNERYLFLRLPEELKRAERYKRKLSLLFLDLDKNQQEFANLPLLIYDYLIQNMGRLIRESFRNVDITVRTKGTRFVVLLPDTGKKVVEALSRLHESLSSLTIYNQKKELLHLRLLNGFSTYPEDALTMEELIHKASKMTLYKV